MEKKLTFKEAMAYLLNKYSEKDITALVDACGSDALIAEAADCMAEDKYKAEQEREKSYH